MTPNSDNAPPPQDRDPPSARYRDFATTHWSVVLAAHQSSPPETARQALTVLCESYWPPLYAFALRKLPTSHDAQEMTQQFFTELLDKHYVDVATPERGRFRSFLLTAFKHFLSHQRDKARAQKRGGGRPLVSLDFDSAGSLAQLEPAAGLTPEEQYDRQWTLTLLQRILDRLQYELAAAGKGEQFDVLKAFIIGDHEGTTYAQAAEVLNTTEAAARKAASRMRARYGEILRDEIARTVCDPSDVEEEIRSLFTVLQKS